jgi:hypothetical protein
MPILSHADCLALWESGQRLHPLDQGLLAVRAAYSGSGSDDAADWPLGKRNRALAQLRFDSFGRWLRGWTICKVCKEKLEFEVDGLAIANSEETTPATIQVDGVHFRLPTARDMAAVCGEPDANQAALALVKSCAIEGVSEPLTETQVEAIGESMVLADPMAEILLHFDCPQCTHSFDEVLDIAAFLWTEIEVCAKRLLAEVHMLASAYGWGEAQILGMSPTRRSVYLDMVRG